MASIGTPATGRHLAARDNPARYTAALLAAAAAGPPAAAV